MQKNSQVHPESLEELAAAYALYLTGKKQKCLIFDAESVDDYQSAI